MIEGAEADIEKLPLGHLFEGTFYLRIPYTIPPEFKKVIGALYMKENLVSWEVVQGEGIENQFYYRAAYHEPNVNTAIKREEGRPVYSWDEIRQTDTA